MREKPSRELTANERRAIRKLVVSTCANYDREYGCLPLDSACYMLDKWWTGTYCKYFQNNVLPNDKVLEAALNDKSLADNVKPCAACGGVFSGDGRKRYCSTNCAETVRKRNEAYRARKYRERKR